MIEGESFFQTIERRREECIQHHIQVLVELLANLHDMKH